MQSGSGVVRTGMHRRASGDFVEERKQALRVSLPELVRLVANRVYFSRAYAILYAVMLVLNVAIVLWLAANGVNDLPESFIVLEITVTALLGLEVLTRMLSSGLRYWRKLSNWFEFGVLILCSFSIYMTSTEQTVSVSIEMDELISWAFLVLRYILQGLRLIALLRHRKKMQSLGLSYEAYAQTRRTSSAGIIDFDSVDDDEELEMSLYDMEDDASVGLRCSGSSDSSVQQPAFLNNQQSGRKKTQFHELGEFQRSSNDPQTRRSIELTSSTTLEQF